VRSFTKKAGVRVAGAERCPCGSPDPGTRRWCAGTMRLPWSEPGRHARGHQENGNATPPDPGSAPAPGPGRMFHGGRPDVPRAPGRSPGARTFPGGRLPRGLPCARNPGYRGALLRIRAPEGSPPGIPGPVARVWRVVAAPRSSRQFRLGGLNGDQLGVLSVLCPLHPSHPAHQAGNVRCRCRCRYGERRGAGRGRGGSMTGGSAADWPGAEQIRAARGVFARHRRRRHPDRSRCGFCGGAWRLAPTASGRLVEGCAARHLVADVLDHADQFDDAGRLLPPPVLDLPRDAVSPCLPVPPSVRDRRCEVAPAPAPVPPSGRPRAGRAGPAPPQGTPPAGTRRAGEASWGREAGPPQRDDLPGPA
jgi:hypothetical protein